MKPTDLPLRFESTACPRENKETSEMTMFHNLNYVWNYSEKSSVVSSTFGITKKILNLINFALLVGKIHERIFKKGKK